MTTPKPRRLRRAEARASWLPFEPKPNPTRKLGAFPDGQGRLIVREYVAGAFHDETNAQRAAAIRGSCLEKKETNS